MSQTLLKTVEYKERSFVIRQHSQRKSTLNELKLCGANQIKLCQKWNEAYHVTAQHDEYVGKVHYEEEFNEQRSNKGTEHPYKYP